MGASGPDSINYTSPKALSALLGMKFKIIAAFPRASDMYLAMERGEASAHSSKAYPEAGPTGSARRSVG